MPIENISARLTVHERILRESIMEAIILTGAPVKMPDIAIMEARLDLDQRDVFSSLEAKNALSRDPHGDIAYVYPVSAYPTRHEVRLNNGQRFHAMCAIDSLGSAFAFQQDVRIDSSCSFCNKAISVNIGDGQLLDFQPSTLHVLRFDLNTVESLNSSR